MDSPRSNSVSRLGECAEPTPVEEVVSRGSDSSDGDGGSRRGAGAGGGASRPASRASQGHMAAHDASLHCFTLARGAVYPAAPPCLHPREAFGPRANVMSTDNPPSKFSPEEEKSELKEDPPFEDETGGLGVRQAPEDRDTLPNTETLLFRDGRRRIDMVLVYEEEDYGVMTEAEMIRRERRKEFQEGLEREGLELELEDKSMSFDGKTFFVKVHIPWKALARYAEVMNLKLPTKGMKHIIRRSPSVEEITTVSYNVVGENECSAVPPGAFVGREDENAGKYASHLPREPHGTDEATPGKIWFPFKHFRKMFEHNQNRIGREPSFYTDGFSVDNDDRFLVKDRELFYTSSQRSLVVWQVMLRAKFDDSRKVGIRRLLNDRTYLAAFPLHEGRYDSDSPSGFVYDRRLLYLEWGQLSCWYKKQPLWLIRKYFGDKIGLYFSWLGFYTKMLLPAAVVGVLCFFYGLCTIDTDANMPSKEICNKTGLGSIMLCPLCDKACNFVRLGDSCVFAKLTYLFDNPATVFFAIFMSFWATSFLELWKRRQAVIVWEWDLQNTEEDEEPRPEFEMSVKTYRINPVTREREPYLPTWSKAWRFFTTTSMVLFMLLVVMGAVLGTIVYRISLVPILGDTALRERAKIFTSVSAAMINLIIIMILTNMYKSLALFLTNLENPRTQTEYEDSYTFKIFVFQFVNFYSSLIYIAFFKGRFFKYPGDEDARRSEFLRIKTDVCDPAGCLSELCIQLAIIMVGKQFLNNFLELFFPKVRNWWRMRSHRSKTQDLERKYTRWEEDYHLEDSGRLALFEEYLEMVLQYGFVTLFVAAFPLAPLFALLNNVAEIRLDAYKMLTQARRPLAERVEDIGAWYGILQGVTYLAVVSNAFVIGYTSDFIPRMVYKFGYSEDSSLVGYINSSLSDFKTADYGPEMIKDNEQNITVCQYRGYRKGFDESEEDEKYTLSPQYWHVFAARLAFVVVFEHLVFALTGVMAYAIPDVPTEVRTQIQREKLLEKEAKYEIGHRREEERAKGRDPLAALREVCSSSQAAAAGRAGGGGGGGGGWWGRRLSKVSDSMQAERRRSSLAATVLEEEA